MWGFESLLPCHDDGRRKQQPGSSGAAGEEGNVSLAAQAAKMKQEQGGAIGPLQGPLGRVGGAWQNLRQFLHDVRVEMKHVNWPSRQDVWSTTMVVVVTVAFFGLFFFFVDRIVGFGVEDLLKYFKS
jgi:preprotein translocase subunit SecE